MSTTAAADAASAQPVTIRPWVSLGLLSLAHAVNHAQAVLLPLVYLVVIGEFNVGVAAIAFMAAAGNTAAGLFQVTYGGLTRIFSRRSLLTVGGLVFGGGMAAQALAPGFGAFSVANVVSRIGGSPQHPVGNGLLAEQFPAHRRGFAIAAHIAGGNVGTLAVPLVGVWLIDTIGWRWSVVLFGLPAMAIALAIWAFVRESGVDRAPREPTDRCAARTRPCCATATCCSSMRRRRSGVAGADSAC